MVALLILHDAAVVAAPIRNAAPEGCPVDWQDLMMVLGDAVMKEEDL